MKRLIVLLALTLVLCGPVSAQLPSPVLTLVDVAGMDAHVSVSVPGITGPVNTRIRWGPAPYTYTPGDPNQITITSQPGQAQTITITVSGPGDYQASATSWTEAPEAYSGGSNVLSFTATTAPPVGELAFHVLELDSTSFRLAWTGLLDGHTVEWRSGAAGVPWAEKTVLGVRAAPLTETVVTVGPTPAGHQFSIQGQVTRLSDGVKSPVFPPDPGPVFVWDPPDQPAPSPGILNPIVRAEIVTDRPDAVRLTWADSSRAEIQLANWFRFGDAVLSTWFGFKLVGP